VEHHLSEFDRARQSRSLTELENMMTGSFRLCLKSVEVKQVSAWMTVSSSTAAIKNEFDDDDYRR